VCGGGIQPLFSTTPASSLPHFFEGEGGRERWRGILRDEEREEEEVGKGGRKEVEGGERVH